MADGFLRNREGKIIGRFDGSWLRDETGQLVASMTPGIIEPARVRAKSWATGTSGYVLSARQNRE